MAEELGLPKEGKEAVEEPAQPGEEKAQKKLPPQLNPLLARLARAAARENDKVPGQLLHVSILCSCVSLMPTDSHIISRLPCPAVCNAFLGQ